MKINIQTYSKACKLLYQQLRYVLMPRGCAGCDQPDQLLCAHCFERFQQYVSYPARDFELGIGLACGSYSGVVRRAILEWKDHDDQEITREFCCLLAALAKSLGCDLQAYRECSLLVVPAPSSFKSLCRRGRIHLWPIAQAVAAQFKALGYQARACRALSMRSVKDKAVQRKGALARVQRVKGHIYVRPRFDLSGQVIVLVDDIVTTGSTIRQCARVLRQAGAHPLTALALARVEKQSMKLF